MRREEPSPLDGSELRWGPILRDSSQKTRDLIDTMGDWAPIGKNVRGRHYSNPTVDETWATVTSSLPMGSGNNCCKHSQRQ